MRTGEVRGYVSDPRIDMPSTTNLGYALRTGSLHTTEVNLINACLFCFIYVLQILYGQQKPYTSVVEIAGADVISDLAHYFKQVEQVLDYSAFRCYFVLKRCRFLLTLILI